MENPRTPDFNSDEYIIDMAINLKIHEPDFTVKVSEEILFHAVKGFRKLLLMSAASGEPVFTLAKKFMTAHRRWEVLWGDSEDLLFSVKQHSLIQDMNNVELDVFLAENEKEIAYDYKVKYDNRRGTSEVYKRGSRQPLAKMENNGDMEIWVDAKVHHAFIVALLMIVDREVKHYDKIKKGIKLVGMVTPLAIACLPLCGVPVQE